MNIFSVIIPVYNRPDLLWSAVRSVIAQTYPNIELVIVDDGSTDGTPDEIPLIRKEVEDRGFLFKSIQKANGGASSARNSGIKVLSGEFVQFLDSDDLLHPQRLERVAEEFKNTDADFIITGFNGFDPDSGKIIETHTVPENQSLYYRALAGKFWGNSLRCSYRTSLIRRMGPWDEKIEVFEDREFSERGLFMAEKASILPDVLAHARRVGNDRLSNKLRSKEGRGYRIQCEERLLALALETDRAPQEGLSEFASRLYGLGVRSYAEGWVEHGRACGRLAQSANASLNSKGKQRKLAWHFGIFGGQIYGILGKMKNEN